MNKAIFMGRVVADPDIYETRGENPIPISKFRLAVNRRFARPDDEVQADFFSCTAFGKLADFAEKFLRQGIKIIVTGRIENDNYTNRDGDKVYGTNLILETIEFAESKKASEQDRGDYDDGGYADRGGSRGRSRNPRDDGYDRDGGRGGSGRRGGRDDGYGRRDERDGSGHRGSRNDEYDRRDERGGADRRGGRDDGYDRRDEKDGYNRRGGRDDEYDRGGSRGNVRNGRGSDDGFMDMDNVDAESAFD